MSKLSNLSRSIRGKVVLITGAGSGMGRATAHLFSDEGAKVIVTDINKDRADRVTKEITDSKGEAINLELDVSSKQQIDKTIEEIQSTYGALDCLINNAGISLPSKIDVENYSEIWDKTISVLLNGQVEMIRSSLDLLRESESPRIVNISSTEGFGATPGASPYTAAKHGVIGLTRSLATELGKEGITVNCICPGPITTDMTSEIPEDHKEIYSRRRGPLKRYGEPEEVAHATLSLCLPASSFINGAVLTVDGGMSIKRA